MARRVLTLLAGLLAVLCLAGAAGCGGDDGGSPGGETTTTAERIRERTEELRDRARRFRERASRLGDRLSRRVRDVLDDLERAVPETSRELPRSQGRTETSAIDGYLTEVIGSVDGYWTSTLRASGIEEPRVRYLWVAPGERAGTACRTVADDNAAFYCPADDTIYVAQALASDLWNGLSETFPGERAGYGRAIGDFGLAYVLAHEYAHNVQAELGLYRLNPRTGTKAFELQADCMAGLWANSVLKEGRIRPGDVDEAVSTATAAGDFDYTNEQHHGTPAQRRDAWLLGYETGEPARCFEFLRT